MTRARSTASLARAAALAAALSSALGALAQPVVITGGPDDSGQNYRWRVENRHPSASIVEIIFPHYHADQFDAPPGWDKSTTNLQEAGAKDAPGECRAAATAGNALGPGGTAEFAMRIARSGARQRSGVVTVRFDDGSRQSVSGVTLPTGPSFLEQYMLLIGLCVIFALVVLTRRRRGTADAAPASETPASDASA